MMRLVCSLFALLFAALSAVGDEASRPNVLIVMADDCTFSDLPVYGGKNAKTPHLDSLARQGLVFDHAYLTSAMCQPCRAELYSGQFPMRNGCAWNHSASHDDTLSMPHHLGRLGYRVGLAGKVHVKPEKVFPFERVGGFDRNCVRNPTQPHSLEDVREFITRDPSEPFCLVVALVEPHVPWVMGDASAHPPGQLELPPTLADTKKTREAYSRYLAEITYMDGQVGELLKTLNESGREEQTLVLFTSEQGSQFPGCKWTNWDTGLHTALIARWPEHVPAGQRTGAMVHYADVLPTLLEAAGDQSQLGEFDGTSFLSVLRGENDAHREYVYGMHNNVPEGPSYPIRTVSDGTYRYMRNLRPDNLYFEKHLMGHPAATNPGDGNIARRYWDSWIWNAWQDDRTRNLVERYMRRPAEAVYHTADDPYELENLAGSEAVRAKQQELREELDHWMAQQGDPGAEQDTRKSLQAARRGEHRFRPSSGS